MSVTGAMRLRAHAKTNFFLSVGALTEDGYHEITSVMQSLSLADELFIFPSDHLELSCDIPGLSGPDNLVMRAAELLRAEYAPDLGARLELHKRIPVAAGLGGGSADAAAALVGLDAFWDLGLSRENLLSAAASLGSDVSFCLSGGTALATGFGEVLDPLPAIDIDSFIIAKPPGGLATAKVYAAWDEVGAGVPGDKGPILAAVESGERSGILEHMANDLDKPAAALLPEIDIVRQKAREAGAALAMVSGSGSSLLVVPGRTGRSALKKIMTALQGFADTFIVRAVGFGVEIEGVTETILPGGAG